MKLIFQVRARYNNSWPSVSTFCTSRPSYHLFKSSITEKFPGNEIQVILTGMQLSRVDKLHGDTCTYVCPKLGLISQDKHMSVLNYGLFARKYYFGLFCNFARMVVSYVLKHRLFQNFWLSLDTCKLFQLAKRDMPSESQISEGKILWLFHLILQTCLTTVILTKSWDWFMSKTFCPKVDSF